MIYRVKQFFQGLFAALNEKDKAFINKYLSKEEQGLFFKLRMSEQYHSLKVAYGCAADEPQNRSLIRAALLHDIGKMGSNLHLINKSLVVLIIKFHMNETIIPPFLKKAIYYKEMHPQIGYELLLPYKIDEDELMLIKNHHEIDGEHTKEIELLQYYDNKY